jgi:hypothetical protein
VAGGTGDVTIPAQQLVEHQRLSQPDQGRIARGRPGKPRNVGLSERVTHLGIEVARSAGPITTPCQNEREGSDPFRQLHLTTTVPVIWSPWTGQK